ncbi:MAG: prepilin-type N-terminal cleavage/methylation domain-containing protein [Victivallales bacterium]|nr:prepilin-type N-terminal cleavage/methylation domain-containing protein [Victivallales bacterium]
MSKIREKTAGPEKNRKIFSGENFLGLDFYEIYHSRAVQPNYSRGQALNVYSHGRKGGGPIHSNTKPNTFTLIELLVVVGIIAILAAMLLPALAQAKERGMGIACMSNLKNMALTAQMYVDDHDNFWWCQQPLSGTKWSYLFQLTKSGILPGSTSSSELQSNPPKVAVCPSLPYNSKINMLQCYGTPMGRNDMSLMPTKYGFMMNQRSLNYDDVLASATRSNIRPSERIWFSDSFTYIDKYPSEYYSTPVLSCYTGGSVDTLIAMYGVPAAMHNKEINIVTHAGNAESVSRAELSQYYAPVTNTASVSSGWMFSRQNSCYSLRDSNSVLWL